MSKKIQTGKFKIKPFQVLIGILILGASLRLVNLSTNPPSLYWEEAALGYDAYSILKTGKDYHGNAWPIVAFESFGDYKPSGYFYATVPTIALFGLNEVAVRLPSALAGIFAIYLIYVITRELGFDQQTSLLASLLLAITPWHIHFSRAAFEVNVATTLLLAAVAFIINSHRHPKRLIGAAISAALSMYTYHGLRLLAPLLMVWFAVPQLKLLAKTKWFYLSFGLAIVLLLPLISAIHSPQIKQRFSETSLFSVSSAVMTTNAKREACGNTFWCRAVYHRYWYWSAEIGQGILRQLNPLFLTLTGDNHQRHQTQITKQLYMWELLAAYLGLIVLFSRKRHSSSGRKQLFYLLGWLLLATIPAALTKDTPHALRYLPAVPAYAILSAVGLNWLYQVIKQRPNYVRSSLSAAFVLMLVINLAFYLHEYHWHYPVQASQQWQYGYKQVIHYLTDQHPNKAVSFTRSYGRPSIYALFYTQADPTTIQLLDRVVKQDQSELLEVPPYSFINNPSAQLLVSDQPLAAKKLLYQTEFLDGKTAFYVYENQ